MNIKNNLYLGCLAISLMGSIPLVSSAQVLPSDAPESICGLTVDWQDVEQYDGLLGPSVNFVDQYESAVGQIQWNNDLAEKYENPGNVNGVRWCSGTLIGKDLFLTAGHCLDIQENDGIGWDTPLDDNTGVEIPPSELALNMHVNFGYQFDPYNVLRTEVKFPVVALREYRIGGLDYAVIELGRNSASNKHAGDLFRVTTTKAKDPDVGEMLTIIQHPRGLPKVVEAGNHDGADFWGRMRYSDLDTDGGSSGSGVLDPNGEVVGVHVAAGCHASGGANTGVYMTEIADVSPMMQLAVLNRVTNFWKPDQAIHVELSAPGTVSATNAPEGWWRSHWSFQKTGNYYRIRNRWNGDYLHMENHVLESGPVSGGWLSAQWVLQSGSIDGGTVYRIRNRWLPDQYLHIEHGHLEAGSIEPGWHSAWWHIDNL